MFGNKERLSYLWDMNETNTPQAALDILANAVAELEALRDGYRATIDNYHEDETACYKTAKQALDNMTALEYSRLVEAAQELQKKFS